MGDTVRAAVVTEFAKPLSVQDVPLPDIEVGGVLGRVDAATLCGTDVHIWSGHSFVGPEKLPYIPGHETAVTVVDVGGNPKDIFNNPVQVGQRIIGNYPFCGHCYHCAVAMQPSLCLEGARYGRERVDQYPYLLGGTAEYHYYPPGADFIPIPDDVPAPLAASAACALRTAMHAAERLGPIKSHETVLVQGQAQWGSIAWRSLLRRAPIAYSYSGRRSHVWKWQRAGAPQGTMNIEQTSAADRKAWLAERTRGLGVDVVIQAATAQAIPEAVDLVRRGGRVISIGGGSGNLEIPAFAMTTKYLTITSVLQAEARHFLQAVQFLSAQSKHFPFESMITGSYSLENTTEALQRCQSSEKSNRLSCHNLRRCKREPTGEWEEQRYGSSIEDRDHRR